MKRRNAEIAKMRRPMKKNKITEGFYGSTLLYLKFVILWVLVILADFILEFRFEFLWPFYLLLRSVYDSFKYQGLAFSVFFVCVALTSDMLCFFFVPVHWLFFAASTYVWVQYVWHTDRGICAPTVILWVLFVYLEAAVRLRDVKHMPGHLDLCRPFAAHCIGYPVVTLGFGFKSYVGYRMRQRKQQVVAKENQFYMQLMQQALPVETNPTPATVASGATDVTAASEQQMTTTTNNVIVPVQSTQNNNSSNKVQNHRQSHEKNGGHLINGSAVSNGGININNNNNNKSHHHRKALEKCKDQHEHHQHEHNNKQQQQQHIEKQQKASTATSNNHNHHHNNHHHHHYAHTNGVLVNADEQQSSSNIVVSTQQHQHDHHQQSSSSGGVAAASSSSAAASTSSSSTSSETNNINNSNVPSSNSNGSKQHSATRRKDKNNKEQDKEREATEYLQRLELDAKRLRNDLNISRASEQDLRLQVVALTTAEKVAKGEISSLQRELEDVQQRLQNITSTKSSDKQTISNLERRIAEERRLRANLESQLNQERKNRKQEEARAAQVAAQQSSRTECTEQCKARRRDLETELSDVRQAERWHEERRQVLERENAALVEQLRDTDLLMSALSAMQEKNAHLENSLSAENRIKLDLFSALGEAKRQLELRENANRAQEKEIEELKSKIAQVLAVMPNETIGISSSNNISRVRLAESPPSNLDPNATAYTPKNSSLVVTSTEA